MAIDLQNNTGRSLLWDSLAQNDVDMNHFKLLNLDTSNLPISAAPPTINPGGNLWLKAWDNPSRTWTALPISFPDLNGVLTGPQQAHINGVGVIGAGTWQGNIIQPPYLPRLNHIIGPDGPMILGGAQIKGVGLPTEGADAVNLGYLQATLTGLKIKEAVKCATTAPIGLIGFPIIDGYQTQLNDRVLIKDMTGDLEYLNGIWLARSGIWTTVPNSRATDADTASELTLAACYVLHGTVNGGTTWIETNLLANIGVGFPVHFVIFANSAFAPPGPAGVGVPPGGTAAQVLSKVDGTDYNTQWVDPSGGGLGTPPRTYATLLTNRANPTGTTDTTGRMMGLAAVFTAITSGKVVANITGFMYNTSAAGAAGASLVVGSGSAPRNGQVQPPGTSVVLGGAAGMSALGASKAVPFSVTGIITGITPGLPFWFDLLLQAITTGVATVGEVSVTAYEIP